MKKLKKLPAWRALAKHHEKIENVHMRDLFSDQPERFERFSLNLGDILFDFSKNRITAETISLLIDLAHQSGLTGAIGDMFAGKKINSTENRPVLHVALRNRSNHPIRVDGEDIMLKVNRVLGKMKGFSDAVRNGKWTGYGGEPIVDIVTIGIGGSQLGPSMVSTALGFYARPGLRLHFVSNVDGTDLASVLNNLNPRTTLFVISSKSFTTKENIMNAETARQWFLAQTGGESISNHFVGVSANPQLMADFGIDPENMFEIWDWVGGRYSVWSAIGLPVAIAIGMERFEEFLGGAHTVDEHFHSTPFHKNIPVMMGLLGIWYNNFFNSQTHAVLPYDQYLSRFPAYLQQAEMESNGKSTTQQGESVDYSTGS
ncbi:MAG: glucose-6-phosphate isomerase, partial [Deltaproteobacteria bacterium]